MKTNLSRLLTLFALITINIQVLTADGSDALEQVLDEAPKTVPLASPLAPAKPVVQPEACAATETPIPEDYGYKCIRAIQAGAVGITKIPVYKTIFSIIGIGNGMTRIVSTVLEQKKTGFNAKNIAAGIFGLASIWSGLNGFTNILNFHDNFTNLTHLISSLDFLARPSFLATGINAAAGDDKKAYSGITNYLGAAEVCAKFIVMAPMLIKTVPIFYKLLAQ